MATCSCTCFKKKMKMKQIWPCCAIGKTECCFLHGGDMSFLEIKCLDELVPNFEGIIKIS